MKTKLLLFVFFSLIGNYFGFTQPANDNCIDAESLTISTTSQTINFDLTQASINFEEGCVGLSQETNYADVWYQFTLAQDGGITITSYAGNRFALYDSCSGTQLECFAGTNNIENLFGGNTYFLRVYRRDVYVTNSNQDFSIQTIAASAPDCSSTLPISVTTNPIDVNFDLSTETLNYEYGCNENDANSYKDIWYEFTMPVNGSLEISSSSINLFSIYDSCNGAQIACFAGGELLPIYTDNLIQGQTYLLRVFRNDLSNTNFQTFTIKAIEPNFPACSNPQTITVSTTELLVDYSLNGANYNYEFGCETTPYLYTDFWYEFTMSVNGNIFLDTDNYSGISIYDSCGGTMLHCYTDGSNHVIDDLVQGQTYTLRVFTKQTGSSTKQFTIQAFERIVNDDCANAEMLPILTSDNTLIQFQLRGATLNTEETCSGTVDDILDAWWQVTMPITGNLFIDTPGGNGIAVYDACNGNELFCNASEASTESFKLIDNVVEGNTYLIRFFNTVGTLYDNNSFETMNLRVYERAENDVCTNAESIPTITDSAQVINFYTFGSEINEEYGCGTFNLEDYVDVWFEFTMPNLPGNLTITSYVYNHYAVFDACNGNEIHCFQGSDQVEGLIPGETYILRAFQRQNDMFHPYAFFDIWVDNTLGIEDQSLENTINIYPNPVRDYINISIPDHQTITAIQCYDLMGKEIFNSTYKEQINVSHLKSGLYLLKIETLSGSFIKKIIIE